jgi:hypothetical protein
MPRLIYELEKKRLSFRFLQSLGIGACPVPFVISVFLKKNWIKRRPLIS